MTRALLVLAPVALLATLAAPAESPSWADAALKPRDGLLLWLDAGRQDAAWKHHGRQALVNGARMDAAYDASGQGHHFLQSIQDAQPRFVTSNNRSVLRFDGKDDALTLTRLTKPLDAFTVFLVAAPRTNAGFFRAFLSGNETGKNDYVTGFNIDLGGGTSADFSVLNIEGRGFGGFRNLMRSPLPLGEFQVIEVTSQAGRNGIKLFLNGQPAGQRNRDAGAVHVDQLTLGARCYSNSPDAPSLSGFLDGDVAELLLYDRLLSEAETKEVREYLAKKHAGLGEALASTEGGHLPKPIDNPPPVQMLVPGFSVRELPLELTNINNVRYRHDGKLVALAYNGNIFVLSDTDGDGLEDQAKLFFDGAKALRGPIGIALTPKGYPHGSGLFVASKGKVSLILDHDGDDRADKEVVVATGWQEIPQNVDALGVALAKDGSVYFALGCANYANGYLLDKENQSHFDLKSERGTVQKVAPDFKSRETICTGVRFPVAMAFNRHGDLFASEQEGATWLPNGNPFDELLHIEPKKHYGFPPRHPKHLPNVIDEPSVFDYGPQHQSTCGMVFNESVNGGPVFGPKRWDGDAILCGESRGKLYRTKLVKTPHGYVAQNHIFACLNMLTVDACVSPAGDLVVATHSGPPDWGTGPLGKGKLYKISYRHKEAPQPVLTWSSSPREVRIAFDRPLDPLTLQNLVSQVKIEYGVHARAGDRFEVLKPPYAIVQQQLATPRHYLAVLSAGVTADRRTLILTTAPHPEAVHYAVMLPSLGRLKPAEGELPQLAAVDLDYTLQGVHAEWQSDDRKSSWSGWLPHLDLAVSQAFTAGSAEHDVLWKLLQAPGVKGTLRLRTQLDLWNMLRPAIQPGATLDYTLPLEKVDVHLKASGPIQRNNLKSQTGAAPTANDPTEWLLDLTPKQGEPLPLDVTLTVEGPSPTLGISFSTNADSRGRALALRRFLLPWANAKRQSAEVLVQREIPELKGGDWARGRTLFFSDQAACSKCHQLRGQGGRIGPDVSNLIHRDYASVLRDLREPSVTINPDHVTYVVHLKDGRVLTGVPRTEGGRIILGDNTGKEVSLSKGEIEAMQPSPVSTMPDDVEKNLGPEKLRDLLTFLLTEPLVPAPLERRDAPPPRSRAEVEAVLKAGRGASHGTQETEHRPGVRAQGPRPRRARLSPVATALDNLAIAGGRRAGQPGGRLAFPKAARNRRRAGVLLGQPEMVGGQGGRAGRVLEPRRRAGALALGGERPRRRRSLCRTHRLGEQPAYDTLSPRPTGADFHRPEAPDHARLRQREVCGRELLEPGRRSEASPRSGYASGRGTAPTAVLDARARQGTGLRQHPGPLYLDLRRPALPHPGAARRGLDRQPAGRPPDRSGGDRGACSRLSPR